MNKLCRLIFINLYILVSLNANSAYNSDINKYKEAKKHYASIIKYNNKTKEIKYLKELIFYGARLNKNIIRYKKELRRLNKNIKIIVPKKIKYKKYYKTKFSIVSVISDNEKIVIRFNKSISKKDIRYFTRHLKYGYQYTFDIKGKFKDAKPTKLFLDGVKRTKIVQYKYNILRISLTNNTRIKPIYIVNKRSIIIKIKTTYKQKKMKIVPKVFNKVILTKQKTIVIDAGHGGKDVGAVGPYKRYEKIAVLSIAKKLYSILKRDGYRVYLTRNADKYVSLRYRTKLANRKKADIFISIHANATVKRKQRTAQGIETYFLSPARSDRAKRVAAKENKTDMNNMGWSSQSTFLTVLNQGKITASNKMAIDIHKNMLYNLRKQYGNSTIRDGGVREGPFWVLVGAQMPSILIEIGYITHPRESKRLYSLRYQKIIAQAIANGIASYFRKNQ